MSPQAIQHCAADNTLFTSYGLGRPGLHSAGIFPKIVLLSLLKSGAQHKIYQLIWVLEDMGSISIKYFSFFSTCFSLPYNTLFRAGARPFQSYFTFISFSTFPRCSCLLCLPPSIEQFSHISPSMTTRGSFISVWPPLQYPSDLFWFASVSFLLVLQICTYWVAYDNTVSFKTKKTLG